MLLFFVWNVLKAPVPWITWKIHFCWMTPLFFPKAPKRNTPAAGWALGEDSLPIGWAIGFGRIHCGSIELGASRSPMPGGNGTTQPPVTHRAEGQSQWFEVDFVGCTLEHATVLSSAEPPRARSKLRWVCEPFQLSGCCIIIASWTLELLLCLLRGGRYLTQEAGRCVQYPFCTCAVLLHKGEELPFPHRGRIVQDLWADCPERRKHYLSICFLSRSRWGWNGQGAEANHFSLSALPSHHVSKWLVGQLDSEPGWGVVIYCWPLVAINYYMPWRIAVIEVGLWLRGGPHGHQL